MYRTLTFDTFLAVGFFFAFSAALFSFGFDLGSSSASSALEPTETASIAAVKSSPDSSSCSCSGPCQTSFLERKSQCRTCFFFVMRFLGAAFLATRFLGAASASSSPSVPSSCSCSDTRRIFLRKKSASSNLLFGGTFLRSSLLLGFCSLLGNTFLRSRLTLHPFILSL